MTTFLLFVLTASVCILVVAKLSSIMIGNVISLPHLGIFSPTNALFFYPSVLYQVGFWTLETGLLTVSL